MRAPLSIQMLRKTPMKQQYKKVKKDGIYFIFANVSLALLFVILSTFSKEPHSNVYDVIAIVFLVAASFRIIWYRKNELGQ
jgi:hypothetical protein